MTRREYLFFMYVMRNRRKRRYRKINKYKKTITRPAINKKVQHNNNQLIAKKQRNKKNLNKEERTIGTVSVAYIIFLLVAVVIFPPVLVTVPIFCIVLAVMVHRYRKKYPNWKERNTLYNKKK